MDTKILPSLILLTYKGKALLAYKKNSAIDEIKHNWCLIGGEKGAEESFEDAMSRRVETETCIKVETIDALSKYCYHAKLTDDNVNNIKRAEGQLLDFFTLKELQKLSLTTSTREFIMKYGDLIEKPTL